MVITIAQVGCVLFLWIFIVYVIIDCIKVSKRELADANKKGWIVKASRVGKAKGTLTHWLMRKKELSDVIALSLGRYYVGNHILDDIYVDSSRGKTRIHLNVLVNQIRLTVMQGEVVVQNYLLTKDCEKEVVLHDQDKLILGDVELRFTRGGASRC